MQRQKYLVWVGLILVFVLVQSILSKSTYHSERLGIGVTSPRVWEISEEGEWLRLEDGEGNDGVHIRVLELDSLESQDPVYILEQAHEYWLSEGRPDLRIFEVLEEPYSAELNGEVVAHSSVVMHIVLSELSYIDEGGEVVLRTTPFYWENTVRVHDNKSILIISTSRRSERDWLVARRIDLIVKSIEYE